MPVVPTADLRPLPVLVQHLSLWAVGRWCWKSLAAHCHWPYVLLCFELNSLEMLWDYAVVVYLRRNTWWLYSFNSCFCLKSMIRIKNWVKLYVARGYSFLTLLTDIELLICIWWSIAFNLSLSLSLPFVASADSLQFDQKKCLVFEQKVIFSRGHSGAWLRPGWPWLPLAPTQLYTASQQKALDYNFMSSFSIVFKQI